MDTPVEIVFHNMPSSSALENDIRKRIAKLDRRYHHLVGCRVAIEQLNHRHQTGNLFDVHIELRVPGDQIVVSHEPHHARDRFTDADVGVAMRSAFKAAQRRLDDYKRRQRGEVKPHEAPFAGSIAELNPSEDHGFIQTHEGSRLYFHRNSMVQRDFDQLREGDRVHFVEIVGDTGPIASKVWRAEQAAG